MSLPLSKAPPRTCIPTEIELYAATTKHRSTIQKLRRKRRKASEQFSLSWRLFTVHGHGCWLNKDFVVRKASQTPLFALWESMYFCKTLKTLASATMPHFIQYVQWGSAGCRKSNVWKLSKISTTSIISTEKNVNRVTTVSPLISAS